MSEVKELEEKLSSQQADYLKRLENAGQLPTVISKAVAEVDGGQTAKLRTEEGDLLKKYVSAGATNREKYKDVWDPFARDRLAANATAQDYSPIADIRSELAMRAEALGVATGAAVGMYNADTDKVKTNMAFTESAYSRAYQREQEATRQRERAEEIAYRKEQDAIALAEKRKGGSGGGGGGKVTEASAKRDIKEELSSVAGKDGYVSPASYKAAKQIWTESGFGANSFDDYFSDFVNPVHYQRGSGRESYGVSSTVFNNKIRKKLNDLGMGYDD